MKNTEEIKEAIKKLTPTLRRLYHYDNGKNSGKKTGKSCLSKSDTAYKRH